MHSTHLRNKHIHGVLLGVAVGEALGYARSGLTRRGALKLFGGRPARYQFGLGKGVYGENTRLMLINAQALLNSRNEMSNLRPAFMWRLSWSLLSFPYGISRPILLASLRSWLLRFKISSGVHSQSNAALSRCVFCAPAIHGTGHRLPRWADGLARLTHTHPAAVESCRALAVLADYGSMHPEDFDRFEALDEVLGHLEETTLKQKLEELKPFLADLRSPRAVARHFGWSEGISSDSIPTAVMAAYCFLRYPSDFRRAVESAVFLGGDTATLGAVVGGLSGSHLGNTGIPKELVERLGGKPHGPEWIDALGKRFSHWPHGSDDLYMAPAQTSNPSMQILRNLGYFPVGVIQFFRRLPYARLK